MSKIFLQPEVASGLGEDTFWTWFSRETGAEFELPKTLGRTDVVLHYSTKGRPKFPNQTINLLWELYPEMSLRLGERFARRNKKINKSLVSRWATVATPYSRAFYPVDAKVLPIAVDTELFKQVDKNEAKNRLGLDLHRPAAFWSGANHKMKGPDLRDKWFAQNPNWQKVIVPKETPISQKDLVVAMSACDGFLNTSRLVPFFMVDWECMAAGLPMIEAGGITREFELDGPNSREVVFARGWDRATAIKNWMNFIERCRFELASA